MKKAIQAAMIAATGAAYGISAQAALIDLVTNGDFGAGDTGFTTDLLEGDVSSVAGGYIIGTNPRDGNGAFPDMGDNTTGTGNMMIINGSTTPGTVAWQQSVSVMSGQTYEFGFALADLFSGDSIVDLVVDSNVIGTFTTTGIGYGNWQTFGAMWNATSSATVDIQIVENTTSFVGNDYGLDDISFTTEMTTVAPVPLPASAWLLAVGLAGMFGLRRQTST